MADKAVSPDEMIVYLTRWAADNGCTLDLQGEVGFGRECIGIIVGSHYPDTQLTLDEVTPAADAYHKHDCLCVLGRGTDRLEQLYDWVKRLDEAGYFVHIKSRKVKDVIDLMFTGAQTAFLTKDRNAKAPQEELDEFMARHGQ